MVFGIGQLTHERVPFDCGDDDGGVIYFQRKEDLTPTEFAKMSGLEKKASLTQTRMEKAKNDADSEKAFTALYAMQAEFVALILPEMPTALLESLALTQQTAIIKYWRTSEDEEKNEGEGE